MLLIDDLLAFPVRGFMRLCREIERQARLEREDTSTLTDQLTTLYMELETGRITQEEFDRAEAEIVGKIEAARPGSQGQRPQRSRGPRG
jgi:hypothetical protein